MEQPKSAPVETKDCKAVIAIPEGISSDILDLAWSAFELRTDCLVCPSAALRAPFCLVTEPAS
jgi:hypothetical protein